MMVAEEEALKKRLMTSIETCRNEMEKLCMDLQLPVFEVGNTKKMHIGTLLLINLCSQ